MTKWLVTWKLREQFWSLPDAERTKAQSWMNEMTEAMMKAGLIKDWGAKADNSGGYCTFEGSEIQCYEEAMKYSKFISIEAIPVIPYAESLEAMKKLTKTRK